jgi:hypothetical protein
MIILGPVWLTIIIYFYTIKKIIDVKRERKKNKKAKRERKKNKKK